uniref:Uncharacterized protein n=1 Tax=Rhizophora mucronata TaxID=61149 RepID=A0A2P2Q0Q1_RHIMU
MTPRLGHLIFRWHLIVLSSAKVKLYKAPVIPNVERESSMAMEETEFS